MAADTALAYSAAIAPYTGEDGIRVPPVHVMAHEDRAGGYSLSVELRPKVRDSTAALHAVIDQGIIPGESASVMLHLDGREGPVRTWPCIVTGIAAREPRRGERTPAAFVTLCDPFAACGDRPLWLAFADVDLAELIGAALSAVAGGDGVPSKNPLIPGIPPIEIRSHVRKSIQTLPYVISAGETLSTWVESLCALLKVRLDLVGRAEGSLVVTVTDQPPRLSALNSNDAIPFRLDMRRPISSRNVHVRSPRVQVWPRARGGLLDVPSQGGPQRFGPDGPVAQVLGSARTTRNEAKARAEMDSARGKSSQVRIEFESAQPGLIPGRIVSFADPLTDSDETPASPTRVFGASRWQIAEVAHLFSRGIYRCIASAEKSGAPWHPVHASVPRGFRIVGGMIDDGESKPGEAVFRDRLGSLPVRPVFSSPLESEVDVSWSPSVPLISSVPAGGGHHGFVNDARQGDVCRIRVHTPLFAEIAGYTYRDDRTVKPSVRESTAGFVLHQEPESWRGIAFELSETEG